MAIYVQPKDFSKRVRFYDGQFLQAQDFIDEQKYHLDRQRRHNKALHISGIAVGLGVETTHNPNEVKVLPGTAIDRDGRQIVLEGEQLIPVTGNSWLYIAYHQVPDENQTSDRGTRDYTRWKEAPCLFLSDQAISNNYDIGALLWKNVERWVWNEYLEEKDGPPQPVLLAQLTLSGYKVVIDPARRTYSGLRLPAPEGAITLRADSTGAVNLWMKEDDADPGLTVTSSGNVGIGTPRPAARLDILQEARSMTHPASVKGLYVTGGFGCDSDGIEFRHSNGTQGIGFGYNTIYATGSNPNQDLGLKARGTGKVVIAGSLQVNAGQIQLDGNQKIAFSNTDTSNNLKLQLWDGYGVGINNGTLFYAANGHHSWRDINGTNERMLLTTGADGGLTVRGTGVSSFAGSLNVNGDICACGDFSGRIRMEDTRGNDTPPNQFHRQVSFDFKDRSVVKVPGAGTYSGMMTLAPWYDDSGNACHQLNFNDGGIFWRTGLPSAGSWGGEWLRVATHKMTDNFSFMGKVAIGTMDCGDHKLRVEGGGISTTGNLHTQRGRLAFSDTPGDPNHTIYNNNANLDGEGIWDGIKMNVYAGLDVRVGEANGKKPSSALSIDKDGNTRIYDKTIFFRGGTDSNHGIGWFGISKLFANRNIDGPVLYGYAGGALGTTGSEQHVVLSWNQKNVGIGTTEEPAGKLEVVGAVAINDGAGFAVKGGYMASGSLTIGSIQASYGGGSNYWNSNTAGLLLETQKNTEIAVHDSNHRVASLMYYEGDDDNRITIGRNMGWGAINEVVVNGNVRVCGSISSAQDSVMKHRMYPNNPLVYQDIFDAKAAGAIARLGNSTYNDTTYAINLWCDRRIIQYGDDSNVDGNGALVTIPPEYDTLWVRVLGERWTAIRAYFTDGSKEQLGIYVGGYRAANCYGPDGTLSDSNKDSHQWLPIPTGRSGKVALIASPGTTAYFWLSGLAFSKNPWSHAAQSAVGYHWKSNGGEATSWGDNWHNWNSDVLSRIDSKTNLLLKVPVLPSGQDKLLYLVEHNNNWNGCMHNGITVNGTPIERFSATYDNPFARHWNGKSYNRYIAAKIPAALIGKDRFLDVRIDMNKQNEGIHFREIGTHNLYIRVVPE